MKDIEIFICILCVTFMIVFACVWSAHDARKQTTDRFKSAVNAGLSCTSYLGEDCTILINKENTK